MGRSHLAEEGIIYALQQSLPLDQIYKICHDGPSEADRE